MFVQLSRDLLYLLLCSCLLFQKRCLFVLQPLFLGDEQAYISLCLHLLRAQHGQITEEGILVADHRFINMSSWAALGRLIPTLKYIHFWTDSSTHTYVNVLNKLSVICLT